MTFNTRSNVSTSKIVRSHTRSTNCSLVAFKVTYILTIYVKGHKVTLNLTMSIVFWYYEDASKSYRGCAYAVVVSPPSVEYTNLSAIEIISGYATTRASQQYRTSSLDQWNWKLYRSDSIYWYGESWKIKTLIVVSFVASLNSCLSIRDLFCDFFFKNSLVIAEICYNRSILCVISKCIIFSTLRAMKK